MGQRREAEHDETATLQTGAGSRAVGAVELPPRWRVERMVGRGGQAEVWLAQDLELDQPVAVKVFGVALSETERCRVRQEVRLGRTLEHPNLVRVYELLELEGRPALLMEWLPGGSLAARVGGGPMPLDEVVAVADQTLAALAYLHERRVVHRDIKPSNLLLDRDGRVRLSDLGLVRQLDSEQRLTRTAAALGTPAYMSPEQVQGLEAGPPSDLYSLGVTLFHLLTGSSPFPSVADFELANHHLHSPPPDPRRLRRDCPVWLARFILRLLEKAPRDRWPDAASARRVFARRRVLASPRLLRRAALALVLLAAAATAFGAALAAFRGAPEQALADDHQVVVTDRRGRELWRRSFPARLTGTCVGDFLGEGTAQVAVGEVVAPAPDRGGTASVRVLGARGEERLAFPVSAEPFATRYPDLAPAVDRLVLAATDLDHDARAELLWNAGHPLWYPAMLGLWWPDEGRRPQPILVHSGWIHMVVAADIDRDGVDELVASAVNNPLGFQQVVMCLEPRWAAASRDYVTAVSPDQLDVVAMEAGGLLWYTPLGTDFGGPAQLEVSGAGITLTVGDRATVLDLAGNPRGSPLEGLGPTRRADYWRLLAGNLVRLEQGQLEPEQAVAVCLGAEHAVLAEAPMRLAAELLLARSLARGGNGERAVAILQGAVARDPGRFELRRRLAELMLIAGQRRAGLSELEAGLDFAGAERGPVEGLALLAREAALAGDRAGFDRALAGFPEGASTPGRRLDLSAMWSFDRGEWWAPELDGEGATEFLPVAAVLRRWAALERGGTASEVALAAGLLAANPEVREVAELLQAHALSRAGTEPDRARLVAAGALASLRRKGRDQHEKAIWIPLAEWVAGETAAAGGLRDEAAAHFRRGAALAPACWFGCPSGGSSHLGR